MSLAQRCQDCFDASTRVSGANCFGTHLVESLDVDADSACALVEDSTGGLCQTHLEWPDAGDGKMEVFCDCQQSIGGVLCEHIWATLLTMDSLGFGDAVPGTARLEVTQNWDEAIADEFDESSNGWSLSQFEEHFRRFAATERQREAPPSWQSQIQRAYHRSDRRERDGELSDQLSTKQRQVWYVLDVRCSVATRTLIVELFQRETKKSGDWGKIKRLSVQREAVDSLPDPQDQRLVGMLLGNKAGEDAYHQPQAHDYLKAYSCSAVMPSMFEVLLPSLCATGRFVWLLDSVMPIEEAEPIRWDDGAAWQFRLVIESDARAECWRMRGRLQRNEQTAELDEVVFVTDQGLILFPGVLARCDCQREFRWIELMRERTAIEIPYRDREQLLARLSSLRDVPPLTMPEDLQVEQVRLRPRGRLSIQAPRYSSSHEMFGRVAFEYDGVSFNLEDPRRGLFDAQRNCVIVRDGDTERELLTQLKELGVRLARSLDRDGYVEFPQRRFVDLVRRLTQDGWIVESEGIRIRRPGSFNLSVSSQTDWFELDGRVDFEGVTASLPALLQAVRSGERYILLDDGSRGMLPEQWLEKYGQLAKLGDEDGGTLKFASSQALLLDALLAEQENVQVDRPFARFREQLRSFEGIRPRDQPRGFHGQLRDYQREGIGWLDFLRDFGFGGCLADDMGLGKTIQVLALLQSRRARRLRDGETRTPSIVVVPKSLVFNWMDEAARFTPKLRVLNYTGGERAARLDELTDYNLIVTTYGTLRRDIVQLKEIQWDYAILDESQAIKNHNSQAAKACRLLRARHRLAMTGTPVENHLGELWSLFEFLNPGMLGSSSAFAALAKNGRHATDSALPLLSRALRPFMLRRTKDQVLSELPEKTEQTLLCEMPTNQRKLYDELREYYRGRLSERVEQMGLKRSKIHVLEALLRLRQAACHPGLLDEKQTKDPSAKIETLLEQLDEVLAEGHKALVFSQFTSLLAIVRQRLDERQLVYEYLDGRTRKRAECVNRFQQDPLCQLFLISLKAGGQGLNLTAADYVFILDPWWNPAVEAQAVDRAHRIGQQRRVFAYRLICRDTVEEKILELQRDKRDLADAIISADNNIMRDLTSDDLQLLLS